MWWRLFLFYSWLACVTLICQAHVFRGCLTLIPGWFQGELCGGSFKAISKNGVLGTTMSSARLCHGVRCGGGTGRCGDGWLLWSSSSQHVALVVTGPDTRTLFEHESLPEAYNESNVWKWAEVIALCGPGKVYPCPAVHLSPKPPRAQASGVMG